MKVLGKSPESTQRLVNLVIKLDSRNYPAGKCLKMSVQGKYQDISMKFHI